MLNHIQTVCREYLINIDMEALSVGGDITKYQDEISDKLGKSLKDAQRAYGMRITD